MTARKPTVAYDSERQAKENISVKLDILTTLLSALQSGRIQVAGSKPKLVTHFPLSLRQFNLWDTDRGPTYDGAGRSVHRNSHETLRRYPAFHRGVISTIAALKSVGRPIGSTLSDQGQSSLRRRLAESEMLRSILEHERIENAQARANLETENDSLRRKIDFFQKLIKERNGRDAGASVAPLRSVQGEKKSKQRPKK